MIAKLFISEKKSPLLALLNSKRLEISPKNGWRARVLARRSFSEVGGGGPMISFPNWRYSLYKIRTFFEAILMRNESFRHCLAEPRQPRKKNTPCISDLAGVEFLLKKERVFFFRGSALQVFGQCGGAKCGLGFAKA